jgi:hypothetical protein
LFPLVFVCQKAVLCFAYIQTLEKNGGGGGGGKKGNRKRRALLLVQKRKQSRKNFKSHLFLGKKERRNAPRTAAEQKGGFSFALVLRFFVVGFFFSERTRVEAP